MLTRKEDWDLQLHNFIDARATMPFAWGLNDCCLFVCDAIEAETGVDVFAEFRGKYSDEAEALAQIRGITGSTTVEDAAAHVLAAHEVRELSSVLHAQRGDVVIFDGELGPGLGIVHLNGIHALFVTPAGLRKIPVRRCRRAWHIGRSPDPIAPPATSDSEQTPVEVIS